MPPTCCGMDMMHCFVRRLVTCRTPIHLDGEVECGVIVAGATSCPARIIGADLYGRSTVVDPAFSIFRERFLTWFEFWGGGGAGKTGKRNFIFD